MGTTTQNIPRKSWNKKGSVSAKRRMKELRQEARHQEKVRLIDRWVNITGRRRDEWWEEAQKAGLKPGCGTEASIQFLLKAIREAE